MYKPETSCMKRYRCSYKNIRITQLCSQEVLDFATAGRVRTVPRTRKMTKITICCFYLGLHAVNPVINNKKLNFLDQSETNCELILLSKGEQTLMICRLIDPRLFEFSYQIPYEEKEGKKFVRNETSFSVDLCVLYSMDDHPRCHDNILLKL